MKEEGPRERREGNIITVLSACKKNTWMRIDVRSLLCSIFSREFSSRFMLSFQMSPWCHIIFLTTASSASGAWRKKSRERLIRGDDWFNDSSLVSILTSAIANYFVTWNAWESFTLTRPAGLDKNCTTMTQMHVQRTGLHFEDRKKAPFLRPPDPAGAFAACGKTCGIARVQVWSADIAVGPTQTSTSVVHHRLKFDKTSSPRSQLRELRGVMKYADEIDND